MSRNKLLRDKLGRFVGSRFMKVLKFEIKLLGAVAIAGGLIYFWTPILINAVAEKVAQAYTQGF